MTPAGKRIFLALQAAGEKGLTAAEISDQADVKQASVKVLISRMRADGVPISSARSTEPFATREREAYRLEETTR